MKNKYQALAALLSAAFTVAACTIASIDTDKVNEEGGTVAENGYIKSLNIGRVDGTETMKTLFHTDGENYGLTTWEAGENGYVDQLSFILRDDTGEGHFYFNQDTDWQRFLCQYSFTRDSYEQSDDIKWAKFTVNDEQPGLLVGGCYYAYYMNRKEEKAVTDYLFIDKFDQTGQTDESLQNFMRDYDYLLLEDDQHDGCTMRDGGIIAESLMKDVYMYHFFSLVEVDIHWKADMSIKPKFGPKTFKPFIYPFSIVQFGSGNGRDSFGKSAGLDGYGALVLDQQTSFAENTRKDPSDALVLTQSNNLLKYYFLIHPMEPTNHYWIKVFDAPTYQRTIHYVYPEGQTHMFKPGYYYKFEIDADFSSLLNDQDPKEWQDHGILEARNAAELEALGFTIYHENN